MSTTSFTLTQPFTRPSCSPGNNLQQLEQKLSHTACRIVFCNVESFYNRRLDLSRAIFARATLQSRIYKQLTGWSKKSEVIAIQCKEYKIKRKELSYKYIYNIIIPRILINKKKLRSKRKKVTGKGREIELDIHKINRTTTA